MKQIITSLLDFDLYKISMLQVYYHFENATDCEFVFVCRDGDVVFTDDMCNEIDRQIRMLENLVFKKCDLEYLEKLGWFKEGFLRYLSGFGLFQKDVKTSFSNGKLFIRIKAPIVNATLYETYVLSIVSEVYHKMTDKYPDESWGMGIARLAEKCKKLNVAGMKFADFGTRRRYSKDWHENVVKYLSEHCTGFVGTSNVYLARLCNVKPIGTMAHEWIMCHQAFTNIDRSERMALDRWLKFYEGSLGTALTDTLTTDHFLKVFNGTLARAFTGVRQDSGDPIEWGWKMIRHYGKLGIDAKSKTLVFSDSLNFEAMDKIHKEFKDVADVSFGIGTNLTNDLGVKPLNIVMKMMNCNGYPLIKLSDCEGKIMCEDENMKRFVKNHIIGR